MLIDEIIELLSDENSSLSGALLKTNVLLHKIGKKDLAEWVKYELEGYPENVDLPPYRILPSQLLGNASNIAWQVSSHPLPTYHLDDDLRETLLRAKFSNPLNALEALAENEKTIRRLPVEYGPMLSKGLDNDFQVTSAWCETSGIAIKGTLMQIRAKLLDFLLSLKDSLGDVKEPEMKEKAAKIDTNTMFNNAMFGSNTTIIIGNQNNPNVKQVVENDFNSLAKKLEEIGVPQEEIKSLKVSVDEDIKTLGKPSIEGKTGGWLTRILAGAKNGSLGVGVEAVTSGVTKALLEFVS